MDENLYEAILSQGVMKKTYFVMAENMFIKNPNIKPVDKMVYLCLCTYAGNASNCFPSKETIANDLDISLRTVADSLKRLEDMGGILIINRLWDKKGQTSNLYILSDIDKTTGDFVKEDLDQFKELKENPLIVKSK